MEKEPLIQLLGHVLEAIHDIHKAFGAPGDFGYETPEGAALFHLYRRSHEVAQIVDGLTVKAVEA